MDMECKLCVFFFRELFRSWTTSLIFADIQSVYMHTLVSLKILSHTYVHVRVAVLCVLKPVYNDHPYGRQTWGPYMQGVLIHKYLYTYLQNRFDKIYCVLWNRE